jgi:hypothetical protein
VIVGGHIAGVPVEETVLGLVPVATVLSGVVLFHLRQKVLRRVVER